MSEANQPKRGEVWLANFDPTLGSEIKKIRPAVILSADAIGKLPIKLVAPITDWKPYFESNLWHIKLEPTAMNGLSKLSAIDALQLRGLDTQRFIRKLGNLSAETILLKQWRNSRSQSSLLSKLINSTYFLIHQMRHESQTQTQHRRSDSSGGYLPTIE